MKVFLLFLVHLVPCWLAAATESDFIARLREAELAGDRQAVAVICREWHADGHYSPGLLNWNYNALMSVEDNALLITQQESDTYPAMMLQYALGVRPDVRIINLQLADHPSYRNHLIQSEQLGWMSLDTSLAVFLKQLLLPANTGRPVYLGSMLDKSRLQADREKLYLTGLTLKFSSIPFDNLAMLRLNYENRFHTDYLELELQPEPEPATLAKANLNYLPAFLLLHRHYLSAGETEKASNLENLSLKVARAGGKEAEVLTYFNTGNPNAALVSAISIKSLEKRMKKVKGNLYASETEMTNGEFEVFLTDLLKNKDFDQIAVCKVGKADWPSLLPDSLRALNLNQMQLFPHGHPDGPDFPVQNISHEAARRYCQWITQVYNNSTEKKKYKKVIFRLPTAEEWELAARAGRQEVIYPWGGYFVRNSKGCYLGNYQVACSNCKGCTQNDGVLDISNDGGMFPVKVTSYFPNDFNLYSISGNVAEMLDTPGLSKGGSWMDIPYYGQIQVTQKYEGPSPALGFRVFMEVIEQ
ncbi:MAG: SUMF1/EgtB/PvdO family nonheme iron enzyme [Saprospiraceae bacterium]|nr:SUMF1/EgtB/PvdO family nonheme iron enzyme [Saprospiraceae bacterium]